MKNICLGILAHVDAGKTSLCESLLYKTSTIKSAGRVDNKDSFLDTDNIERNRGITIYSKTAVIKTDTLSIQLVDTPGHIDFSAEMERSLRILDYAIILVSALDGVKSHTKTLFKLLEKYNIPCFIFINKMDLLRREKKELIAEIKTKLSSNCIDFLNENTQDMVEEISLSEESIMNKYLEAEKLGDDDIKSLIKNRKIFPIFYGSALKHQGIDELLVALERYTLEPNYDTEFSGVVYKISRDKSGLRQTHIKVSDGSLSAKDVLNGEKINQIRIYNGDKYESTTKVYAGSICVLSGLNKTYIGQSFGNEKDYKNKIEAVLSYHINLPNGEDIKAVYPKLRQLNEEEPELDIIYKDKGLAIKLMGEVQLEVLKTKIKERFNIDVEFEDAQIVYKESIRGEVLGLGHFEPLRHYAEVHLLIKEAKRGSGISIKSSLSTDSLNAGTGNSIKSYLQTKELKGVLLGKELTDIEIEIINAKIHNKHTEGGDLREASLRALRQGLMYADNIILEPFYEFELSLPSENIGRALSDLDLMSASFENPDIREDIAFISGIVPLSTIQNYNTVLASYTKGEGSLSLSFYAYMDCHNTGEILESNTYNANLDMENPSFSVFCDHGESFIVEWDRVKDYIHLDTLNDFYKEDKEEEIVTVKSTYDIEKATTKELMEIFERTYGKINPKNISYNKAVKMAENKEYVFKKPKKIKEYILIDGYNVIFAWKELKDLANTNIDAARDRLVDILTNYKAYIDANIILVFDAYKVANRKTEVVKNNNIYVVYTKTAETADQYIEKTVRDMSKKYKITVVTSDGIEQIIIRSAGCLLMSSRELYDEIKRIEKYSLEEHREKNKIEKTYLLKELMKDK